MCVCVRGCACVCEKLPLQSRSPFNPGFMHWIVTLVFQTESIVPQLCLPLPDRYIIGMAYPSFLYVRWAPIMLSVLNPALYTRLDAETNVHCLRNGFQTLDYPPGIKECHIYLLLFTSNLEYQSLCNLCTYFSCKFEYRSSVYIEYQVSSTRTSRP